MADLSSFDTEFEKAPVKPKYDSEQSKEVGDGDYDCEIRKAVMKETSSGEVFTFTTVILTDGPYMRYALEHTVFFNKKDGTDEEKLAYRNMRVQELKKDLTTLGFDVAQWKKETGRPFSTQLPIAIGMCVGLRVKMRVKTTDKGRNVYLNQRMANLDGRPKAFGAAEMAAAAVAAPPPAAGASGTAAPGAGQYGPSTGAGDFGGTVSGGASAGGGYVGPTGPDVVPW